MGSPQVDVHAHFLPDFYREALRQAGYDVHSDREDAIPKWSLDEHLSFMQANRIKKSYLSLSPPGVLLPSGDAADPQPSASLCRLVNDYGSSLKRRHPAQLGYLACLPFPDLSATYEELHHCETRLSADGYIIHTHPSHPPLGSPAVVPLLTRLSNLGAVLFVHAAAPCRRGSHPQRLATTRGLADVILSDLASAYPALRFVFPDAPRALERVVQGLLTGSGRDLRVAVGPSVQLDVVRRAFSQHCYFDLAGLTMSDLSSDGNGGLQRLVDWAGNSQLLFGSAYPFGRRDGEAVEEVKEPLQALYGVETGLFEIMEVCGGNARRLFGGG